MSLELDSLYHDYGDEHALRDVSLELDRGELACILGPSGCGKTTLVQAIAGHLTPTSGEIRLRGRAVTDDPPESREVGIVFQESSLFPHLTVGENVAYGLRARGIERHEREEIVAEHVDLVGLDAQIDSYPTELSGGQRRRVELARALAPEPDVLLLDEPLSALDRSLRERLRGEIGRIQRETGVTTLVVTHDQETAMALADRLVLLRDGTVAGIGTPRELYESPPSPFVASFLGYSSALSGTVTRERPLTIVLGDGELRLDRDRRFAEGESVTCPARPDAITLEASGRVDDAIMGRIVETTDLGRRYNVTVELTSGERIGVERRRRPPAVGTEVRVGFRDGAVFAAGRKPVR